MHVAVFQAALRRKGKGVPKAETPQNRVPQHSLSTRWLCQGCIDVRKKWRGGMEGRLQVAGSLELRTPGTPRLAKHRAL